MPSGCRRSTAAMLRTIRRSLCLWALHSNQDPPDRTTAGARDCFVSATPKASFDMRRARGHSEKLRFHYAADSRPSTSPTLGFSSTPTRTGSAHGPVTPIHITGPSARSRARARVARDLGVWVVPTGTRRQSRSPPPPPNHKISLRRARDEPPRARARVVAHALGSVVTVCTSSFCTYDEFFSSNERERADVVAWFSEIER